MFMDRSGCQVISLLGVFLFCFGLSYIGIGYAQNYFPALSLVLFLLLPTIYGLVRPKSETVIVILGSILVANVIAFFFPFELS